MKIPAWAKKLPKEVTICGKRWKIKFNMRGGSMLDYRKSLITVGCNSGKDTALEGLIHEISEAAHIEMRFRYMKTLVAALRGCGLLRI